MKVRNIMQAHTIISFTESFKLMKMQWARLLGVGSNLLPIMVYFCTVLKFSLNMCVLGTVEGYIYNS
jgi:hypothetical protein